MKLCVACLFSQNKKDHLPEHVFTEDEEKKII